MRISDWSSDVCSSDLLVLADFSEPVPRVEALRAEVLRPHPDPQRARALALQPVERGGEQLAAPAAVLVFAQQVEALELAVAGRDVRVRRSEEHTSELQSLMRISYAVFCLKKKTK